MSERYVEGRIRFSIDNEDLTEALEFLGKNRYFTVQTATGLRSPVGIDLKLEIDSLTVDGN